MDNPDPPASAQRLRELFEQAIAQPPAERSAFLDAACQRDENLRQELTQLLQEAEAEDTPLDSLLREMVEPALESLSRHPSHLEDWVAAHFEAEEDAPDPLIGKTISHFQILAPIGRGGMGMVYRARDLKLDRDVALKFLPPAFSTDAGAKQRFIHEAKAASGLDHPNIATVHEIGETPDRQLFIAMGFYPGETLKARIERGPLSPEIALDHALQLARGLQRAHAHEVIHRDIKPGNIIVTEEGTVVLLDFGLAKLSSQSGYTQAGQMLGTIAYMSPEQTRGEAVDHRTDLWSFGVVLYEMLTGQLPFGKENAQTTLRAILEEKPEPPSHWVETVPKPLEAVLARCLAKKPDNRYASADALLSDLERARDGLKPQGPIRRRTWKRSASRTRAMATFGAALLTGAALILQQSLRSSPEVTFTRVTEGPLVEDTGRFAVISWGDYDDDGLVDVAVTDSSEDGSLHLYHNAGEGQFERVTEGVLASDPVSPWGLTWADPDNDGDLDAFVLTDEKRLNHFYRNDGAGDFSKITEGHWVNTPAFSQSAAWGDYDRDGWLDLYVANSGLEQFEADLLYHNRGDGIMEPVENEATRLQSGSHGAIWSDFDGDGDLDLLVGGQDPLIYRNEGEGIFSGMPAAAGGIPEFTEDTDIGLTTVDYDNDGDLDVFYVTWKPDAGVLAYRNDQNRLFKDVTHILPPQGQARAMSTAWGDYDNDGYQDLFVTNLIGNNLLYHNNGDGRFERVKDSPVVELGRASMDCAWVDYDNDGDLDLSVANGMWSEFPQTCELYRNEGNQNHWIVLSLRGTTSNRFGIGAKVFARATINDRDMVQLRELQGGGYCNHTEDLRVHFGLGDATAIDTLRIEWPSGIVQELLDVAADQFLTITEEVPAEEAMPPNSVTFTRITEGAIVEDTGKFVGAVWGDLDGDGFLDLIVGDAQKGGTLHYYHNNGDGSFRRVTEGILATDPIAPMGGYPADFDNDGDLDVFVCTDFDSPDAFYRNDGRGDFTKVTEGDWVSRPISTHASAWGDYDNDGFVDLYLGTARSPVPHNNLLYRNQGDGTMEAVECYATSIKSATHGAIWTDYDNDGDLDIVAAGQDPLQFTNEGNGLFKELGPQEGGIPEYTEDSDIGFSSADYDNDGDLDLLYATWKPEPSCLLYRNDRGIHFQNVTHVLPQTGQVRAIGTVWGDYDNDGYLDLFIANTLGNNLLFHNEGDGSFAPVTDSPAVKEGYRSSGCAWVDYDNDGDLDLHVANGIFDQFEQPCELYRNDGGTNHWIVVGLVGTQSNRSAIGAKVWAITTIGGKILTQLREIQSGGNGQNGTDLRAHFGLGNATSIDFLRIEWPSGIVEEIHDVAANQFLTITENPETTAPPQQKIASPRHPFTPITEGPLVEDVGNFGGYFWGDYDGDGHVDLLLANEGGAETIHQYQNIGDGTFRRTTTGVLPNDPIKPYGIFAADQDNDGDLDVYVTTNAKTPNAFYRNKGNARFEKVDGDPWIKRVAPSSGASWADYNRDGYIDLYVANAGQLDPQRNFLFRNLGDGTMTEILTEANRIPAISIGCLWSDYNNDGYPDMFVAGQDPVQFRNNRDGTFSGVSAAGAGIPEYTQDTDAGFAGADYDNDGDIDYFYIIWSPESCGRLYRNEYNHGFKDVTFELPSEGAVRAMGAAWGDYDNDGYIDLLVTTPAKNILYHNDRGGTFAKVFDSAVVSHGQNSSGPSWVDYDNDGDLDLFTANGMWATFAQPCELFRNEGNANHWIVLELIGTTSNRAAIGAKVFAQTVIRGDMITQMRELQSGGNGQNGTDLRIHFGLGDATTIETLRIEWPSGIVEEIHDVAANQFLTITERSG